MRITGPSLPYRAQALATARADGGGFRLSGDATRPRAVGVAGGAGLTQLASDADPDARRRKGVRKGRAMLDLLDGLKASLLAQQNPDKALAGLAEELGGLEQPDDARLADILDAVRVRAEVEIAKAEVMRRGARG